MLTKHLSEMLAIESVQEHGHSRQLRKMARIAKFPYPVDTSTEALEARHAELASICRDELLEGFEPEHDGTVSGEALSSEQKAHLATTGAVVGGYAALLGVAAGLNRHFVKKHKKSLEEEHKADDLYTKVHKLTDELRDVDLGTAKAGWFAVREQAIEKLLGETVRHIKANISAMDEDEKKKADAVLERYRSLMEKRAAHQTAQSMARAQNHLAYK